MSTEPAKPAEGAAAPAAKEPLKTVPADIRNRVLGGKPPEATDTSPAAEAEKLRKAKETADAATAAAEKKKKDDAATAAAAGKGALDGEKPRVRKVKDGPALPEKLPVAETRSVEEIARALREEEATARAAAALPKLKPEEEAEVEFARYAEKKHPDKYTGFAKRVSDFYVSYEQHRTAKAAEFGGVNTPEFRDYLESEEHKAFVRENRPAYVRGDREKLRDDQIADRSREETRAEMAPQLKELERQTNELRFAPVIQGRKNQAMKIIVTDPNQVKDPALEGFAADPMKFGAEHPEEAQLIASEAAQVIDLIDEVYRIDHDLVDLNPLKRPQQQRIREFMVGPNTELRAKHPNGIEMPDKKILIDAETFQKRGLSNNPQYRVFTADEIAGMLAATGNAAIIEKLKKRSVGVSKSIYAKKPEAAAAAPGSQGALLEDEGGSPGAPSSAAPGSPGKSNEKKSLASKYA